MKIIKPSVELLWITPNAEKMIERAGRVCYKSEDLITEESSAKFIQNIIKRGHEAVLEHASASLLLVCDRGVLAELTRHRLASYCVESTRFCNYSKDKFENGITVIRPPNLNEEAKKYWLLSVAQAELSYIFMIKSGVSAEIARSVLPNSLKTEIVCTANMREWRHIFKLRTSKFAHPQIIEVMNIAKEILKKECPNLFGDINESN